MAQATSFEFLRYPLSCCSLSLSMRIHSWCPRDYQSLVSPKTASRSVNWSSEHVHPAYMHARGEEHACEISIDIQMNK